MLAKNLSIFWILLILFSFSVNKATAQIKFAQDAYIMKPANNISISADYYKAEQLLEKKAEKKAKRLKIAGLFFTTLGAAGVITTTPFVALYGSINDRPFAIGKAAAAYVGILGYTPSVACLTAGLPMAIVGFKKANKLKQSPPKEL